MELEESPLWGEIQAIMNDGSKPVAAYWNGQIHTPTDTEDIMKIISMDNTSNYETNFGDELIIETVIPTGLYIKLIYPNRSKLEITLFKTPLAEIGDEEKLNEFKETERFKAVPILEGLPTYEGSDLDIHNQFTLDLQTPLNISFQLFNKSLEKLRTVTVGGVFRKIKNEDVIKALLTRESMNLNVNGKKAINGVELVSGDNQEVREHTVIPQGVKLLSLSTYVQERCNGVYNYGIGTYLQRKVWYVYPLYNVLRFNESPRKAIIYKVPKLRFNGVERTYRFDNKTLHILATSSSKFSDDANTNFMNDGNGVRLANASKFMDGAIKTQNNKAVISRKSLNNEIVFSRKEDGMDSMYTSSEVIGSNMFLERSKIAGRGGSIVEFVWDNANPSYLTPGMVMKIIYMDNDTMQELNGVLLSVQTFVQLAGTGITVKKHLTTCNLSIYVNRTKR